MSESKKKEYYTVSEVAEKYDVSPSTVWRWIKDGKLSAYRVGGRIIRIKNEDLDTLANPVHEEEPELDLEARRAKLWEGYDPEAARKALHQAAGTWADVDAEEMIEFIYRAREEGSRGMDRPDVLPD